MPRAGPPALPGTSRHHSTLRPPRSPDWVRHRKTRATCSTLPTATATATTAGSTPDTGSHPPDQATARLPARWVNQPSAVGDRPALCTHRNNTTSSLPVVVACALSSAAGDRYLLGQLMAI